MNDILRALGRALVSLLHPRMLWLTAMPFVVSGLIWGAVIWFGWVPFTDFLRVWLEQWQFTQWIYRFFGYFGIDSVRMALAPFILVALLIPLIVVTALLLIAGWSMPAVLRHLSRRHYIHLEARQGGSFWGSLGQSLGATVVFLVAALLTLPLWLVPPFFAIVPPLLWGWLTYRVMTYDALAYHASAEERRRIVRERRLPLLVIGVATGLLGSLPTLLWVSSVIMIVMFPVIALLAIWLYVVIFIFSALWFAHYCLRALSRLRTAEAARHEPMLAATLLPVASPLSRESEDLPPALPPGRGSSNGSP
ncbi:EI24 domain-containing protein [Pandoraea soli]|uniref:Membrane protein n=1 Tax=Pandoraea soli TaxID=2508293 RepID=A0ABY6W585_9BURK|nr:EI24 domain-containing protein [Pandoraea soli]VVE27675.1 membrane protein [Pandoraea soli]